MSKWVYTFGNGSAEGDASMRNLLGGKGANLAEMNTVGLPVPPGFTVTTEVCTYYYNNNKTYPSDLKDQVRQAVSYVEGIMGKKFADAENPLLFSVRSGKAFISHLYDSKGIPAESEFIRETAVPSPCLWTRK